MLGSRQLSLSPSVHVEAPLPSIYPALFVGMRDRFGIDSTLDIVFDALNSLEDEVGRKVRELLYAAVSDDGRVVVLVVPEKANFDNWEVAAQAGVRLIFTPDMLKPPLKFRLIPSVCHAEFNEPRSKLIFGHDEKG